MTARPSPRNKRKAKRRRNERRLRLKPADPFELIRWLARSQSDPRKAIAELVQNSLDAGARHVTVERRRIKRALCISVRDDGAGVLPDMDREKALAHIATHIGRSHKRGLDPAERHRQVIAGQYGVGLLGFWSVGRQLELRSRVRGSKLYALRLEEDRSDAAVVPHVPRTDAPDTFTEAIIIDVHPVASRALSGRRLSEYLAAELRGQLLARDVELTVHDRVARGLAQKQFQVVPKRFLGERLDLPAEAPVPEHSPMRIELYLARGTDRPGVQVGCAGTLVADDIADLAALDLRHAPWVGRDLVGLIDFADFTVPPGTRRGVLPDAAARVFCDAIAAIEPAITAQLDVLDQQRRASLDRDVVRELRRALKGFRNRLPQYDLPSVEGTQHPAAGPATGGAPLPDSASEGVAVSAQQELLPPGPLASVRIAPSEIRIAPGSEHRIRATACDARGRSIASVTFEWSISDPRSLGVEITGTGPRPALRVPARTPLGARASVSVTAREGDRTATADAPLLVADTADHTASVGIPEPHLVNDPGGTWRSRMSGDQWEVNESHEDYLALRNERRARVRYLLSLLGKELVARHSTRPDAGDLLESLVEILAHAERNLSGA